MSTTSTLFSGLSEQLLFFELFVHHSIPMLLVKDDMTIVTANRQFLRLTGYAQPSELIGAPLQRLLPPYEQERVRAHHQQNMQGIANALPFDSRIELLRKDAETVTCELSVDAIPTSRSATPICTYSFLHSAQHSPARRLENKMLQGASILALGQLSSSLAHEIKNPLHSMVVTLELLRAQLMRQAAPQYEEASRHLDTLSGEVARLDNVIRGIIDFARPITNKFKWLDLNELCMAVVELLYPRLKKQKVQLIARLAHDLPSLQGDASQLKQVVLNLLLNAVQAMPEGGKLIVRSKRLRHGHVLLSITDNGRGIERDAQDKVFQPYYSTREPGAGLGLPMVLRLIENHGGSVRLRSKPGKGSHFVITLPGGAS